MEKPDYCSVCKKCSGCQLSNMDYAKQLKFKQNQLRIRFNRLAKLEKILPSPDSLGYRNKAQFVFKRDKDGRISWGIYQSVNQTMVKTERCSLHTDKQNKVGKILARLFCDFKVSPYDLHRKKGLVKSAVVRESFSSGDIMVVIVCHSKGKFPTPETFAKKLCEKIPEVKSVILTECDSDRLHIGENPQVILGDGTITDTICSRKFIISCDSFFQINSKQTENLYSTAIRLAGLTKNDSVLDAYCGTGTIGIIAAKDAGKVYAVEQNKSAIEDAKRNALLNDCRNVEFVCDDSEKYMHTLEKNKVKLTAAFLDPPRAGCSKSFLESLCRVSPDRIVYISCNIDTQLRDLRLLQKRGYKPIVVQGVDMFPYTKHIESVVCLVRQTHTSI